MHASFVLFNGILQLEKNAGLDVIRTFFHQVFNLNFISPDIFLTGISDFRIFGQSFINKNCPSSRTSNDIDMKLGQVTKLDKRNTSTSKNVDNNVMLATCDLIVIFLTYNRFGAIGKPDWGCMVCKTYIFINSNFLS